MENTNNEIEMGAGKDLNAMRIAALKSFIEEAAEEGSTITAEELAKAQTELEEIEKGGDLDVLTHKEAA
ncbi:MAG: hypothetical protein KBB86_02480 [Candidatus Pacebacteria bacterium]|nr:hypothetical protein [Candidatus Paceibacterota bacterium]